MGPGISAVTILTRHKHSWTGEHGADAGVITFGFRLTAPTADIPGPIDHDESQTFTRVNGAQMIAVTQALALWSDLANIDFKRVGTGFGGAGAYTDNATILIGNYKSGTDGAAAFSAHPRKGFTSGRDAEGDVWVNIYPEAHITTD